MTDLISPPYYYGITSKPNSLSQAKPPMQKFIILDKLGPPVEIPVRLSTKAKRIAIKANHKGIELVLPNANFQDGYKFLLQKESWVRKHLELLSDQPSICKKTLPILDKIYCLEYTLSHRCKAYIEKDTIYIHSPLDKQTDTLIKFLRNDLLLKITMLANILSDQYNLDFTGIKIINNKSKWGSCSSKAVISFNWRLVFAPMEILKYVVVHEMCHVPEMNHGKNFWRLVEGIYPNYKVAKLWLKENRNRLYQYLG